MEGIEILKLEEDQKKKLVDEREDLTSKHCTKNCDEQIALFQSKNSSKENTTLLLEKNLDKK